MAGLLDFSPSFVPLSSPQAFLFLVPISLIVSIIKAMIHSFGELSPSFG